MFVSGNYNTLRWVSGNEPMSMSLGLWQEEIDKIRLKCKHNETKWNKRFGKNKLYNPTNMKLHVYILEINCLSWKYSKSFLVMICLESYINLNRISL